MRNRIIRIDTFHAAAHTKGNGNHAAWSKTVSAMQTMTDTELANSIHYLNGQLGGVCAKPNNEAEVAMVRERDDYDRELRRRRFGPSRIYVED